MRSSSHSSIDSDQELPSGENEEDDIIYTDGSEYSWQSLSEDADRSEVDNGCPERDDEATTFQNPHGGTIYSIELCGQYAVCGTQDDRALVWNVENGQQLLELSGHSDSVICVQLNHDRTLLATGDMNGEVKVWKVADNFALFAGFEAFADMAWMSWHAKSNVIFRGFKYGTVIMNSVPAAKEKHFFLDNAECSCAKLLPDDVRLLAGFANGNLIVLHLKDETQVRVNGSDPILCVDVVDNCVGCAGTANGTVRLFGLLNGELFREFSAAQFSSLTDISIESVCFDPSKSVVCFAGVNCPLVVMDAQTGRPRCVLEHPDAVTKIIWLGNYILTSCGDGILRAWDSMTYDLKHQFCGHRTIIYDFVISEDRRFVVSGDREGCCKVFPLNCNQDQ